MAGTGGYRPGAGRPKGSVNSESIKLQERALASGYAPLDVLLGVVRYYYEKAQRLLGPQKTVLAAVEHALGQGGDSSAGTFIEILSDQGFKIVNKDATPEEVVPVSGTV